MKTQDWQRPTVTLLEDGAEKTYALQLRKSHCAQLHALYKAGFPNGMFKGFSDGTLGLEFCADAIALATRAQRGGKRVASTKILDESMHLEPDEYTVPVLTAIALAANMPAVARQLNGLEDDLPGEEPETSGAQSGNA